MRAAVGVVSPLAEVGNHIAHILEVPEEEPGEEPEGGAFHSTVLGASC